MNKEHKFSIDVEWKGDLGTGTSEYTAYSRDHIISSSNKITKVEGSSAPEFRGDPSKYNPEELFISSLSSCHMLWYLHFCADAGIIIKEYIDYATGTMPVDKNGLGQFSSVTLNPKIKITDLSQKELALSLHKKAHEYCFIARSVNFEVNCYPEVY
ncbi:MAG: OsmC family protein [Saprospiraceae bacterium]|nr:OsmC family protein [Saprospiraceae bacterium]